MRIARLRLLDPWAPPLVLMAVIFFFSAQPSLDSGLGVADLIGRKLVHFAEYGLLALLWWRALRTVMPAHTAAVAAFAIASGYAVTDELHQTLVSGRSGRPLDWVIDTTGAAVTMLYVRSRFRAPA